MTAPYFESADAAAAALGTPLLVAASSESAVPRAAAKLSDLAVETMLGGRLYNRLRLPDPRGGQVLWVSAPPGSQEYLAWAIAIAEHAAGFGRSAYLLDASAERPLEALAAGRGLELPVAVQKRIQSLGLGVAAGWASDLAGVRIVLPASESPAGALPPDPDRWSLIVARALPEEGGAVPESLASGIDGVVLVAAIRDHARGELIRFGETLRALSAPFLGLVALGPIPKPSLTPLERWNRVQPWALPGSEEGETPAPTTTAVVEPPKGVDPETAPVSLGSPWRERRRSYAGWWILLFLAAAAAATWFGAIKGWWRSPLRWGQSSAPSDRSRAGSVDSVASLPPAILPDTSGSGEAPADSSSAAGMGIEPDTIGTSVVSTNSWPDTFVVHVNSFNHIALAEREAARLRGLGLSSSVVQVELPKRGRWYRVVVGAFPDSSGASVEAALLRDRQLVSFAQILGKGGRGNPRKSSPQ